VLSEIATRSLGRRQFYVANTRYRGAHRIYVASKREIFARLQEPDNGRELATEFVQRRRLTVRELISVRRLPRMLENLRQAIWIAAAERRSLREMIRERMGV
jgi:hypothetical protein